MEKKVREQIKNLELKIEWAEAAVESTVKEFKDAAARFDAYSIDEHIDTYVRRVRDERKKLAELQEQLRMLTWLVADSKEG